MRTSRIIITMAIAVGVALACPTATAQSLAAPDDPTQAPAVAATPADSTAAPSAPTVQPQHNNPAESFRNERRFIHEGNGYFNDSNYYRALEYYNKALEVNSASIAGRYNKAMAMLRLANTDDAADQRPQAAQILQNLIPDAKQYAPELACRAYYNLGNMAYNDQNYGGAIAMYESTLRLDPDQPDARYNLRLAQLQQQNQDQNQDQDQEQEQEEQQQQQEQQQQEQQQEQQQQPQPMSQSAQQILQSMQNQENATRRRVQEDEEQSQSGRRQPDKPW